MLLCHTPEESLLFRLCREPQERDGRRLAGTHGGQVDIHLEAGHTEDRREISTARLCYRLLKACVDGRL